MFLVLGVLFDVRSLSVSVTLLFNCVYRRLNFMLLLHKHFPCVINKVSVSDKLSN